MRRMGELDIKYIPVSFAIDTFQLVFFLEYVYSIKWVYNILYESERHSVDIFQACEFQLALDLGGTSVREWASLIAHLVKNLPAMQETQVRFLWWDDSLENRKATHSTLLVWRIPRTVESDTTEWLSLFCKWKECFFVFLFFF